ncbi:MAG: two-component regulator propeller domain-containing protein, partial [Phycisphaerae bacterium]
MRRLALGAIGVAHAIATTAAHATPPPPTAGPNHTDPAWRRFTTADGLPHNRIRCLRVDGNRLWVGTNGGLAVYDHDAWTRWTVANGLPWPAVHAIDLDPTTGDLWLGTWGGGLVRFTAGRFDRFDQLNSGLAGNIVFAVVADGEHVWAATNTGISALDPTTETWSLYAPRRAGTPERVATALARRGPYLEARFWRADTARLDLAAGRWTRVAPPIEHGPRPPDTFQTTDTTFQCTALQDHTLWIGTADGLFRGPANTLRRDTLDALRRNTGHALRRDNEHAAYTEDATHTEAATHTGHPPPPRSYTSPARDEPAPPPIAQPDAVFSIAALGPTSRTVALPAPPPPEPPTQPPAEPPAQPNAPPPTPDRTAPSYRPDLLAVHLAVEDFNTRAARDGTRRCQLITGPKGYARYGWATPEDDFAHYALDPGVLGIVGTLPETSRIADAVAYYSEVPVVNTAPPNDGA